MPPLPTAPELECRKQVRLRLRPDLEVVAQRYEGAPHHVVKDPVSLRYYRFDERDHFLLGLFDGSHTMESVRQAFEERFPPHRLSLEDLESFGQQLLKSGLVNHDLPQAGDQLFERRGERRRMRRLQALTNILYIELPLFDPDRLLGALLRRFGWLLSPPALGCGAALMAAALLLVATHFDGFWARLPAQQEFFRFQNLFYLWLALGLVKVLHEVGHGLACKRFGGEVHDMGMLLMCLSPCLYLNITDTWRLPDKRQRIFVGLAGIYVELVIAAVATFVWWPAAAQGVVYQLSLNLMIVCSVNTLLFNGNPLMRYDGYYVLADWLEVPNLRERCNRYLKHVVMEHGLGMEVPLEPVMALRRRILFVVYALASYVYGWVVTFSVLWFLSRFLKPYKLGTVSVLLACASVASMAGWPLYRFLKGLHKRGNQLPEMKPRRVSLSAVAAIALLLAFFLVPLPISRIRQTGLVQTRPEAAEKVFVTQAATLEVLRICDGQRVQAGEVLGEFRSLELETQLDEAKSQHAIRRVQIKALRQQAAETGDALERGRLEVALAQADGERKVYAQQLGVLEKSRQRLVLRAPRSGVVMGAPRREEVGKRWENDQTEPFCSIGDPRRLRMLVPVHPADYRLLKEDLGPQRDLAVTVRVQGWGGRTWRGQVAALPESEAQDVPLALTTRAGGPLAVKPGSRPSTYVPQEQHYLVAVDFLEGEDDGIWPGAQGRVKVHCRWRSAAWWVWRTIASTFDLGLMG